LKGTFSVKLNKRWDWMQLSFKLDYIIKDQLIKKEGNVCKIFLDKRIKLIYLKLKKYLMILKLMNG